jgi:hypothetical protein
MTLITSTSIGPWLTAHRDCLFVADWMDWSWNEPYLLKASEPQFTGFIDEQVEQNMEFEAEEALGQGEISQSESLLPSLSQLVNFVDQLVVGFMPDLGEVG